MVTYNHEKYIKQAIESVLTQKTKFDYELIIGEDYSTDDTRRILSQYQIRNPNRIRIIFNNKNLGPAENFVRTFNACKGTYIALLEGDDYWINSSKLQKQVDLLDSNLRYSMCFHTAQAFYEINPKKKYFIPSQNRESGEYFVEDILAYNFIASCSAMYRNIYFKKLPDWFKLFAIGDWPLHTLYAMHGSIGYIDEVMAKYRIHSDSRYSSRTRIANYLDIIKTQKRLDRCLRYKYHKIIHKVICENCYLLYQEYVKINDYTTAEKVLGKTILKFVPQKSIRDKFHSLLSNKTFLSKHKKHV